MHNDARPLYSDSGRSAAGARVHDCRPTSSFRVPPGTAIRHQVPICSQSSQIELLPQRPFDQTVMAVQRSRNGANLACSRVTGKRLRIQHAFCRLWAFWKPVPPLLQGASGTGAGSACPFEGGANLAELKAAGRLRTSPELDTRLRTQFPSGSDAERLVSAITTQGFELRDSCNYDRSIHVATFFRKGIGLLHYAYLCKRLLENGPRQPYSLDRGTRFLFRVVEIG